MGDHQEEEVTKKVGANEAKEMEYIAKITDQQLKEKIERLRKQIASPITLKLPDNGENLRRSLKVCEEELARRDRLQPTKVILSGSPQKVECEKAKDSPQKAESEKGKDSPQKYECKTVKESPQKVECEKALHSDQKAGCETARGSPEKAEYENLNHSPKKAECENSKGSPWEAECGSPKQPKNSGSPGVCNDVIAESPSPWTHSPSRVKAVLQKLKNKWGSDSPPHIEPPVEDRRHPLRSKSIETISNKRYHHREESPRPSRHRDESPRPSRHRDESPRPSWHRDESPRSYRYWAESPRPYQRRRHDYPTHHSAYRPRQVERTPSIQSILHNILDQKPSISRPRYRSRSREPSESQMEEMLSTVHIMQEQFENVQIQLSRMETQFATRMDKLESKIVQGWTGGKKT
ncbi:hypothetical protein ACHQM5_007116 [Ranunculus cassubicifolius]